MSDATKTQRKRAAKYRRAKIRSFFFTVGPNRLTGGRLSKRHYSKVVVVRDIEIATPRWPREFDGLRIGHVSDFHLGELLPLERALEVIEQLRQSEPDLVACTGDVVDLHHDGAMPLLEAMANIGAPMGTALVLGNHDELHCADTLSRMAREAGVTLLRNSAEWIHRNGAALTVAGIDWAKTVAACAHHVDSTCDDTVDILLAHNPKAFPRAAHHGIPLTLSGHTHGGQIAMKNRPKANLALGYKHKVGLFEQGDSRLYVTAGVGAWFPLRMNCPAEIAMITMRSSPTERKTVVSMNATATKKAKTSRRSRKRADRRGTRSRKAK
jgi:uncharacterized protein